MVNNPVRSPSMQYTVRSSATALSLPYLVIKEELGQQAQILAVILMLSAVELEEDNGVLAVDLVARRVPDQALSLRRPQEGNPTITQKDQTCLGKVVARSVAFAVNTQ